MFILNVKIILLVLLTGLKSNHAQEVQLCFTPDNKFGTCQNVRNCNPMVQFLLDKSNFTLVERKFLNKYQCGYDKNSPNICCPNNNIIVSSIDDSPKVETPSTANVKDHRNLRLLPDNCGPTEVGDRIINGNKTGLFEYPWMALLSYQINSSPSFRCGGTIISNRYILTAAHCAQDIKLFGVRVGEHSIKIPLECETDLDGDQLCAEAVQDFFIEEVVMHSDYNKPHNAANDIALIRLNSDIRTSKSVTAICLPIEDGISARISEQVQFTVTGWGATETSESSDELLQTKVAVVPLEECQENYRKEKYTITETQICARSINGSDSCNGDSGGPIQTLQIVNGKFRYVQSGIVSLGPRPCANEVIPGVYTRVDKYVNWILDNMKD